MISEQTKEYFELGKRNDVRESAKRLRRQYLRYKDAEIVYSIQHKKLLEMASKAGAVYRIDGTVLINRNIFDQYLEQFHEPSTIALEESLLCNYFEKIWNLRNEFTISGVLLVGVVWYVDLIYLKSNIKSKFKQNGGKQNEQRKEGIG